MINNEDLKISHINSNFDNFYLDFMNEQRNNNIKFRVFYPRNSDRGLPNISEEYLDIRLNYNSIDRFFFNVKAKKILLDYEKIYKDSDFNLIHAHTLFSNGYIAYQLNKKYDVPYIVAVRSMDINLFFKYRLDLRRLGIKILQNASRIIFISDNYKTFLLDNYVPRKIRSEISDKSYVIPNGISKYFLENRYFDSKMNENKVINVLTIGYVNKRKNQITVCKALEILKNSGYQVKYRIVGKILDKKIFARISKYDFVEYIPFIPKEELIDIYRTSDIFVMPSLTETFGLTYVEAMTQGLPVIYSKGQGFESFFTDGEIGYSVNKLNELEISNKILQIIENYEKLSEKCVEESQIFDWQKIELKYEEIYHDILHKESKIKNKKVIYG